MAAVYAVLVIASVTGICYIVAAAVRLLFCSKSSGRVYSGPLDAENAERIMRKLARKTGAARVIVAECTDAESKKICILLSRRYPQIIISAPNTDTSSADC